MSASDRVETKWSRLVEQALRRRAPILRDANTTALRLIHGAGDGLPGLVVEQFGEVLVAQLHEERLSLPQEAVRAIVIALARRRGAQAVYRKVFPRDRSASRARLDALHHAAAPWWGRPAEEEFEVRERGVAFRIRPYDGYSVGLFLEQRANRDRVRQLAEGRRVLNVFAYTCGFSVCAALGGAAETVSVDVSKRYLEWGRRNFAANGLALERHVFIRSDALDYFRRARRQGRAFDIVILDPPTFARVKGRRKPFVFEQQIGALATAAMEVLQRGGRLLACTNHRETTIRDLERIVRRAAGERRIESVARPKLPPDFPGDGDYAKSLWLRVN
ncbi:MAG: class I SAM-dependent rRNA methyltransferase [Planctomycetota bacterium]|nr:MAG: class I SAM-dependent rRNA methyltransferase [Planctomycetota bacterium]